MKYNVSYAVSEEELMELIVSLSHKLKIVFQTLTDSSNIINTRIKENRQIVEIPKLIDDLRQKLPIVDKRLEDISYLISAYCSSAFTTQSIQVPEIIDEEETKKE